MARQFIPSNSDEGYSFIQQHCANCARDAVCNGTTPDYGACDDSMLCDILAASYRGEAKEWIEHDDGRTECTAFVPMGDAVPQRCGATQDMFVESP